ncbi:MAG: N-acetylmuramoyl-L-alanine amidase [Rhizobiaceae bacterium]|nr:N-acetylmuramoyl-L-alanine amidase [Rhizobiaceae bacterium]
MTFAADTSCDCKIREAVNFGERDTDLDLDILLLHYTGMASAEAAINWLCLEESGVSCHYVVEENGAIWQLVPEEKRAWHAGKSSWQGEADINSRSIGIEIVNPGHAFGYPGFPDKQIASVIKLSKDIVKRHKIPARHVLAHSDVAPGRKSDPGEKFPWQRLFQAEIGAWVPPVTDYHDEIVEGEASERVASLQAMLIAYGYGLEITGTFDHQSRMCVRAFQQHFFQHRVDGIPCEGLIKTLENLLFAVRQEKLT